MRRSSRSMGGTFCYLGDDHCGAAAMYLVGVMAQAGMRYVYVPSAATPPPSFTETRHALYILSDYPAARFQPGQMEHIARSVGEGSGLLMIGGWESFHGRIGEYGCSPLAEVLPVEILATDDRRNFAQPCLIRKCADHPILAGLPWETPPTIGGLNELTPKSGAKVLLEAVTYRVQVDDRGMFCFMPGRTFPLLVVGQWGEGRTAALATDVAPHWVGGLVDWGDRRLTVQLPEGWIEIGEGYARFFQNLLAWTSRMRT